MRDWAHSRRLGTPADEAGSVVLRQPQPASLRTCSGSMFGTMLCLLQRLAVWWVAPPWPILPVAAVLLALCRLVVFYRSGRASRYPASESHGKTAILSCASSLVSRTNRRAPGNFELSARTTRFGVILKLAGRSSRSGPVFRLSQSGGRWQAVASAGRSAQDLNPLVGREA